MKLLSLEIYCNWKISLHAWKHLKICYLIHLNCWIHNSVLIHFSDMQLNRFTWLVCDRIYLGEQINYCSVLYNASTSSKLPRPLTELKNKSMLINRCCYLKNVWFFHSLAGRALNNKSKEPACHAFWSPLSILI